MTNSLRSTVVALLTAAALGTALPAQAEPVDHAMGSQIARHEGRAPRPAQLGAADSVPGMDVSSWQGNVDWARAWANGARFAYVKATESTTYRNPYFDQQYNGSYQVGMIRGAYHFAAPNLASGTVQADYFVDNGGGWSPDGKTLPGALDVEYNPDGDACYGVGQQAMVTWISDFVNQYRKRTGRWPVIYTSTSWWNLCTGNLADYSQISPLFIANYDGSPGPLPQRWQYHTIWQHAESGIFPGDQNLFNGTYDRLQVLATSRD
ncbi:GH25 family lysozyme M1 (1,4-beta-N-acetylmuramidase) [Crossiella equi]|uniref:Lysozyme n=1 Tax=Crossiella equi TaxID=130796 RepID=A0ABS5AFF1_9PSEU|nr:lysozyme [Crossiella equi]MBP2475316.1 GH25 family lysozyme M1 (1,4-beta-N-acetylmuramidase) [Crossiella equi]